MVNGILCFTDQGESCINLLNVQIIKENSTVRFRVRADADCNSLFHVEKNLFVPSRLNNTAYK